MTDQPLIFRSRRVPKLPPLLLTFDMRRAAIIQDRTEAARRCDMRAFHAAQHELRALTTGALRRAVGK